VLRPDLLLLGSGIQAIPPVSLSRSVMRHYNVLFLCTGNSARSIMAEAILNHKGGPVFTAYSAGSQPAGTVRREAIHQLEMTGFSAADARSKSWEEFSQPDSPHLDFVFTVCDSAALEVCPIWPGQPMTAHWGIPDPAAVRGTPEEVERAFSQVFQALDRRISLFLCLPLATLDSFALQKQIDAIGKK
jgi:arsenate reductase